MNELLSVIIPVFNTEKYLRRCLNSVCNQTYNNIEIICVNDGSTDSSKEILEQYASFDKRIHIVNKKNGGNTSARKKGLEYATGYYTTFVDSDDWIDSDMYNNLMNIIQVYRPSIIISGEIREYGLYNICKNPRFRSGLYKDKELIKVKESLIRTDCFYECNISGHLINKIFNTVLIQNCHKYLPDNITICEDAIVAYHAIWESNSVYICDKSFYHYCLRPDSIMGSTNKINSNCLYDISKYIDNLTNTYNKKVSNIDIQLSLLYTYARMFLDLENIIKYENDILYPFGYVSTNDSICLYGAGKFGIKLYNLLEKKNWFSNLEWVDSEGSNGAVKVEKSNIYIADKIIVAAILHDAIAAIKKQLIQLNISSYKILTSDSLIMQEVLDQRNIY